MTLQSSLHTYLASCLETYTTENWLRVNTEHSGRSGEILDSNLGLEVESIDLGPLRSFSFRPRKYRNGTLQSSWLYRASMISNALLSNKHTQLYKIVKMLKKQLNL